MPDATQTTLPASSEACGCAARDVECALCGLLAYGYGPDLTPEQQAALTAYGEAAESEGNDGPAYRAMVAAGLPQWGEDYAA